jgi:hypothetical protein
VHLSAHKLLLPTKEISLQTPTDTLSVGSRKKKTLMMKPKQSSPVNNALKPVSATMSKFGSWTPDAKTPLRLEARQKDIKHDKIDSDCKSASSKKSSKFNAKGQNNLIK